MPRSNELGKWGDTCCSISGLMRRKALDLLQKQIIAPLAPQFWGNMSQSPPNLGDLGGILGFMQEVYYERGGFSAAGALHCSAWKPLS